MMALRCSIAGSRLWIHRGNGLEGVLLEQRFAWWVAILSRQMSFTRGATKIGVLDELEPRSKDWREWWDDATKIDLDDVEGASIVA